MGDSRIGTSSEGSRCPGERVDLWIYELSSSPDCNEASE
jgi:hypothetical protein